MLRHTTSRHNRSETDSQQAGTLSQCLRLNAMRSGGWGGRPSALIPGANGSPLVLTHGSGDYSLGTPWCIVSALGKHHFILLFSLGGITDHIHASIQRDLLQRDLLQRDLLQRGCRLVSRETYSSETYSRETHSRETEEWYPERLTLERLTPERLTPERLKDGIQKDLH